MMQQALEYAGVALIAVALWLFVPALAIGWVGLYLLVASVIAQFVAEDG